MHTYIDRWGHKRVLQILCVTLSTGARRNQHTKTLKRLWGRSVSPMTQRKSSWSFWFVKLSFFLPSRKFDNVSMAVLAQDVKGALVFVFFSSVGE